MQRFGDESLVKSLTNYSGATDWLSNLRSLCGDRWSLDGRQLAHARQVGIIDKLPRMTEDEVDDLNKGDVFLKVLAVVQIMWLCIQLITRLSRKLPTTQLEVVTLAFAITSIFTYALLYNRPKDVHTVREVCAIRFQTPVELARLAGMGPSVYSADIGLSDVSIPNNAIPADTEDPFRHSVTAILVVFGGLHLLAWNYEFPTHVERILWRASAIVTLATMPLLFITRLINNHLKFDPHQNVSYGFSLIAVSLFVAARAFILVEIIRSLAFQPPETFRTTWAANFPHVG